MVDMLQSNRTPTHHFYRTKQPGSNVANQVSPILAKPKFTVFVAIPNTTHTFFEGSIYFINNLKITKNFAYFHSL